MLRSILLPTRLGKQAHHGESRHFLQGLKQWKSINVVDSCFEKQFEKIWKCKENTKSTLKSHDTQNIPNWKLLNSKNGFSYLKTSRKSEQGFFRCYKKFPKESNPVPKHNEGPFDLTYYCTSRKKNRNIYSSDNIKSNITNLVCKSQDLAVGMSSGFVCFVEKFWLLKWIVNLASQFWLGCQKLVCKSDARLLTCTNKKGIFDEFPKSY